MIDVCDVCIGTGKNYFNESCTYCNGTGEWNDPEFVSNIRELNGMVLLYLTFQM